MSIKINHSKCIACGACVGVCPSDSIVRHELVVEYLQNGCIECLLCISSCPTSCISKL